MKEKEMEKDVKKHPAKKENCVTINVYVKCEKENPYCCEEDNNTCVDINVYTECDK
ncbi:MAG: hypothetical protein PHI05_01630 [Bacilli bacterium]|nr:hypothetical protein [Bacilli bacterium]MDD4547428.1 hypothetical protein [Bacilli bacterium]